ncbi:PVC-type heme-binding CxxCH protein [Negadavirga shengliensis]|uniref:PVC-type heme-binding CxxCH protein n=1 Tax=Negadavirga shengliensis TaxID=1389218 RepID=A0ABV9T019_9BACT
MWNSSKRRPPFWFWFTALVLLFAVWSIFSIWEGSPDRSQRIEGLIVPEGFTVEAATVPGLVKYPMFAVFDDRGRLFVMESSGQTESTEGILAEPDFRILLLEDTDADGVFDHKTVYADNIPFPMGGVYLDGSLIVTASPDLVKFTDRDGDGVADEKEVLLSGWTLNHNAAILSGPFLGPDGWLYMADARRGFDIASKEAVHFTGKGARIWRCLPDGTQLQSFAGGGFDNAIELVFTPSGEVLGTMTYFTDPQGGYRDALMHWVEGGVYPKPHPVIQEDVLVRTGELMPVMHEMARVSPSGLMRYTGGSWGDDFEGDLFHAEFNTGRIVQTDLHPNAASFSARSQHFLTSQIPDFHPTDVLQEPDGSLLVVNTGGWFISGCPLSRTAKPEVDGGIYRIRTLDHRRGPKDPWGINIPWEDLNAGQLVEFLGDSRVKVSDKAGEYLLKQPRTAIPYLTVLLQEHPDEQVRAKAVFLLYRTRNPGAWNQMCLGLKDESDLVKTATARVLGLAKTNAAVDELIAVLENHPSTPLAKQVATALGQIGDPKSTGPLLKALEHIPYDRYFEHAVVFALIQMDNESLLLEHLATTGFNKAALIALDQKGSDGLDEKKLQPYLLDNDSMVSNTALWVLKNHPEWDNAFVLYLEDYFNGDEKNMVRLMNVLPVFIHQERVQEFLSGELDDLHTGPERLMILKIIKKNPPQQVSPELRKSLLNLLTNADAKTKDAVMDLVVQMNLKDFKQPLRKIISDDSVESTVKLKAYQALLANGEEITDEEFRWIAHQLLSRGPQLQYSLSLAILRNISLHTKRVQWLAENILPVVPSGNIPYLMELFTDMKVDSAVLHDLEHRLLERKEIWDNLSLSQMEKIFSGKEEGKAIMDSLADRHRDRLAYLEKVETDLLQGDVTRGRALFFGKAACGTCHAVAGEGDSFGPDLTNIGEIRSRHDILEAILFPSASFAREYETMFVQTSSQSYQGIIKNFENGRYELALGPGAFIQITEEEVRDVYSTTQSLMPAGLDKGLNQQELSDLMLYLQSLPDGMYTRNN